MTIKINTDEALVAKAQGGSHDAFGELVTRYQHRVYATAVAVLSDFELAQDVAQEAFLCAYHDLPKLKDPTRFGAWICGIARYMALAVRRERGKVRTVIEQYRGEQPLVAFSTPDQALESDEKRQVVQRALERLNDKDRTVLSLYYLENMSYAGIGEALGVGKVAVKGRIQRARVRLRKELKMVEEHFAQNRLPEDFVAQIKNLLNDSVSGWSQRKSAINILGDLGPKAVEPLIQALKDKRKWVRYTATFALCEMGDARALQPILQSLLKGGLYDQREEDGWPDLKGMGRLLNIPGMREAVLQHVKTYRKPADHPYYPGARDLGFMRILSQTKPNDDEAFNLLYGIFSGEDEHIGSRCQALILLCQMGPLERAQKLLKEAVESGHPDFLDTAFDLVSRKSGRPPWGVSVTDLSLEVCEKILSETQQWNTREMAADIMYQHGEEGRARLMQIAKKGDLPKRVVAAFELARKNSPEAVELMNREFLGGQHEGFSSWSTRGIHHNRLTGNGLRANAWKLAKECPEQAGPLVEGIYRAGMPQHKKAAVRILARQRGANFLPELRKCLGGGRPRIGEVAREAFWEMHRLGEAAEPMALDMLASTDWLERKAAVCLLRRWGKLTEQQRQKARTDEHVAVRKAAEA